jgi:RNA polymerase sigma-70 factor, ECF subfamily
MELRMNIVNWPGHGNVFAHSSRVYAGDWSVSTFMTPDRSKTPAREDTSSANPHWEQGCIDRLERGNPDGFQRLVDHYSARIYSHLFRMVHNREEAEDLTQETFILAYRKIGQYDRSRPFRNWLYAIATNVGRNAYRSQGRRIPSAREDLGTEERVADESDTDLPERHELKDRLATAVNGLPDPLPMLIQMYYQEGFSVREAADVLGMSESAAKVALHRARKTLRTMLEKNGL